MVACENRDRNVHVVTQHSGSNTVARSQRIRRRDHSTDPTGSSAAVAAIAARTDFSSRLPLRRFACSCARRFARLKTSANEILVRR